MAAPESFYRDEDTELFEGDAYDILQEFDRDSVDACITSPPYLDARPEYPSPSSEEFMLIFSELRRVVCGPLLLNVGRLWRDRREYRWWEHLLSLAEEVGWEHRDTLIWIKPNANPIQGELLTSAHEYVFLFGDGFDPDAVRTPYSPESLARYNRRFVANAGVKNYERPPHRPERLGAANELGARPRSYVEITTGQEKGNPHPAPMPLELALHLVRLSGGGCILDPFAGSGTTLVAARQLRCRSIGIELSPEYARMAAERLRGAPLEQVSLLDSPSS
jgi:DNA modification methylase